MSNYESDHNIDRLERGTNGSAPSRRYHQTLRSAVDSFMEQRAGGGNPDSLGESDMFSVFTNALRSLHTEGGSPNLVAQRLADLLDSDDFGEKGKPKGVSQQVIDSLERVAVKDIPDKENAECPICTSKFVDAEYPLIVKLPCHLKKGGKQHIFDLECIGPWLEVNSTCPMCRFDILDVDRLRKENLDEELRKAKEEDDDDEEEEDDYLYG